jgi:aldehyde dehydrogenase (NAD+)
MTTIQTLFEAQIHHRWHQSQTTATERIEKLRRLKASIRAHEADLKAAMWKDFRKPEVEVEITEVFPVVEEINVAIKNLKRWMKPERVRTPLALFGNRSEIYREARGVVLVISPWNYPILLTMVPLVSAIAAGNCVIAKPSEKTPHTSNLMEKIITKVFPAQEVAFVQGGVEASQALLELPFDHIFFTGSTRVGQIVMAAAAKHLSSVTLELGGKSPTIVLPDANIKDAAEKIAWGRFLNGGQTCVAPDHVYLHQAIRQEFLEHFKNAVRKSHGKENMAHIIDTDAFTRLRRLLESSRLQKESVILGGDHNEPDLSIAATAIETQAESPLMKEEIFGPILPVLTYQNLDELLVLIQKQPKPLALYIFGNKDSEKILRQTTSGAAIVNNVVIHFANHATPLGGVGASGQGQYHGFNGFRTFSHERAVMKQSPIGVVKMLYPPYDRWPVRLCRWFLKQISK